MGTFLQSLFDVLDGHTFALMLAGVAIGFVVGLLPGLGGPVALALMLPFTFGMSPVEAFALLLGMFVVTGTTGDITSVLFGIPGEPTSAATVLDGYPMTRRGEAGRALGAVLMSSLMGAVFGAFVFAASVPFVRPVVLAFGPPEFFALTVVGLAFIVSLSGADLLKGGIMAALGFLVGVVGLDPQAGIPRYTFDQLYLWDGVALVPVVVGLFGGAEVLQLMMTKSAIAKTAAEERLGGAMRGVRDALSHWFLVLRASAIGVGIGVIPGLGGAISQFIAYAHAKQTSKSPETFGKGNVEGVLAAGAVNNSKEGGSLIPTVAFGIPGSGVMAILLSAFLITGLTPGPEMLTTRLDVTFSMVWVMVLANVVAVALSFLFLRQLVKLTHVNGAVLVPFLLTTLALGAYTSNTSMNDVVVMLAASALGIACLRWNWPRVPFLLALVLTETAERYLFISHSLYGWDWLTRPLVLGSFALAVFGVFVPAVVRHRRLRRRVDPGPGPEPPEPPGPGPEPEPALEAPRA